MMIFNVTEVVGTLKIPVTQKDITIREAVDYVGETWHHSRKEASVWWKLRYLGVKSQIMHFGTVSYYIFERVK
jgi:hypothetical protein